MLVSVKIDNLKEFSKSIKSNNRTLLKTNRLRKNKIKIKKVTDNTAKDVEIIIDLPTGTSPNVTMDALYAFTHCEISISPNCCVIIKDVPTFISVNELLKMSTDNTLELLRSELILEKQVLEEKWHFSLLESIFIEKRIYRDIEKCTTWESVLTTISNGLKQYKNKFKRKISKNDIVKLTEIKIKRISKYDSDKQKEKLFKVENNIEEVKNNIKHINDYSIRYFEQLYKKFSDENNRNTEIVSFDSISARRVIVSNKKFYVNKLDGFIGMSLKKDEFISNCSDLDHIIIFLENGKYVLTKIDEKKYIGKNIIYASVWKKNDKHMIYNTAYYDSKTKYTYVKRFSVTGLIKDKFYDLTQGNENSKIVYFTANPNSESEIVNVFLSNNIKTKIKSFDFDYSTLSIKGRASKGNILSKNKIRKITQKSIGESTLGGRKLFLDESIGRLNAESRGRYLGTFNSEDRILVVFNDGTYELTSFDLSNRYKLNDIAVIEKFDETKIFTLLHYEGIGKKYYLKRFKIDQSTIGRRYVLISENRGSKMILISSDDKLEICFNYRTKRGEKKNKKVLNYEIVNIKSSKALGNRLDNKNRMSAFEFMPINDSNNSSSADNSENNNLELF